jgi:hypothetical protein
MARCKEEDPFQFPVVTPIPKGYQQYFECKVNGQLWKPDTPTLIGWQPVDAKYSPYRGLTILANNNAQNNTILLDFVPNQSPTPIDSLGRYFLKNGSYSLQLLDTNHVSFLRITKIDSVLSYGVKKPVFEGEFAFTSYWGRDTAVVTEGKFGLLWRTY